MRHVVDVLLRLYPAEYRAEYGDEMREVFLAAAVGRSAYKECFGLLLGALLAHFRELSLQALATGSLLAFALHLLIYSCLLATFAHAQQQPPKQDPATLELARSIYAQAFTALREAKTLEDLKKLADSLDSLDWISVDRFGRPVQTREDSDREMTSMLNLPPERRAGHMDIIWAEQDADALMVLAWMMPHEGKNVDADGTEHRLLEGTLIRDLFRKTQAGWMRIRHDKLAPNNMILAVDGVPRVISLPK
jgi:hypothetical protein